MRKGTAAVLLATALAFAAGSIDPASAQSIFGLNYLGEHQFPGSARYRALALSAYAVIDSASAVTANQATLADLTSVTFSLVEIMSVSNVRSGSEAAYENRFQLPSVMFAVPLRKGFVLGGGYLTQFEGKDDFTFDYPIENGATAYEVFRHRSGLFNVPFMIAWRPVQWARIAGSYRLERGSIEDDYTVEFQRDYFQSIVSKRVRSFSGGSWSGSALATVHPRLSLAFGFNGGVSYEGDETFAYSRGELDSTATWRFDLPYSWEAGAAFGVTEHWWLNAHFWRRGAPDTRGFEQLAGSIGDERLVAIGVEKYEMPSGGFFTRIPLRFGIYENVWHLEYPAGHPVKSRFFTFGTGFDLPGGPGKIDLSFEIGQIGSSANNGVDERVFRVGLGLSASESWSRRRTPR
jgi:hypothetical protein